MGLSAAPPGLALAFVHWKDLQMFSLLGRWSRASICPLLLLERLLRLQLFLARIGDEPLALRLLARASDRLSPFSLDLR